MINPGNKGEWAEIYIFLKLVSEGKVYMADKNMERLASVFMNILRIFREEVPGEKVEYIIGDPVKILRNGNDIGPDTPVREFQKYQDRTWTLIETVGSGTFTNQDIGNFLEGIHINKLKAPAQSSADFFGGTEDITMEVQDYRTGIDTIMGFSCKSQFTADATLFNASQDNTNFRFKVTGNINDRIMDEFNSIFNTVNKVNKETGIKEPKNEVAIDRRIDYLKNQGCDVEFVGPCVKSAKRNLIQSGGLEMPTIIGAMLKYYFFDHNGKTEFENVTMAIRHLATTDPVGYDVDDLEGMYRSKVGHLLYDMFTGMRMASVWSGRQSVTGGYICAKKDGDVVAYHANVADEFRDFLVDQLAFESPSCDRHKYMKIEKIGEEFFINFNMQFRFAKSEVVKMEIVIEKLRKQEEKIEERLEKALAILQKKENAAKKNREQIELAKSRVSDIKEEKALKQKEIKDAEDKMNDMIAGTNQ